jgi:hypothetical protein
MENSVELEPVCTGKNRKLLFRNLYWFIWLHPLSSRQETASVSEQEIRTFNIYESCLT